MADGDVHTVTTTSTVTVTIGTVTVITTNRAADCCGVSSDGVGGA